MKTTLCFLFLFLIQAALAEDIKLKVLNAINGPTSAIGIGSRVQLHFVQRNKQAEAIFLGRMLGHPTLGEEILMLDENTTKVMLVDGESFSKAARSKMQNVVSTIDQAGETCAAYALYHYWLQSYVTGLKGNGQLSAVMSVEHSRMKLLEESITRYYMGRSPDIKPIMRNFGGRFGFRCHEKIFQDSRSAIEYVYQRTLQNKPVIMEFYLGSNMVRSSYELEDFETGERMDPSLWTPRKIGERNAGGHAIVAAAAFVSKRQRKVLVLDSNWNEPRVWDLNRYLGGRTAISEMIFHSCD